VVQAVLVALVVVLVVVQVGMVLGVAAEAETAKVRVGTALVGIMVAGLLTM